MARVRANRNGWNGYNRDGIGVRTDPDEKLVAFRMSKAKYETLKLLAKKRYKPIAVLINEALEMKFKLSKKTNVA